MNKQDQIPTAEDFVASIDPDIFAEGAVFSESGYSSKAFAQGLRKFTAMHLKAALLAARDTSLKVFNRQSFIQAYFDEVLSCYPEENIK